MVQGQIQTLANAQQVNPISNNNSIHETNDVISKHLLSFFVSLISLVFLSVNTGRGAARTAAIQPVY